jgi:hypothetical protein
VQVRQNQKNSTLFPLQLLFSDEMCTLYSQGTRTTDVSKPVGHPMRKFILRCILLFWYVFIARVYTVIHRWLPAITVYNRVYPYITVCARNCRIGDYPGLGEATSMAHAGAHACHWCEVAFPWAHAMRRHDHRAARCFLRANHPWRGPGVWGEQEDRPPPNPRTHARVVAAAAASEAETDLAWDHDDHPRKASGVDGLCPLAKLPLFNMVWDVCMDYMHIVKVLISGHLLPLLKSSRGLKSPQVQENEPPDPEVTR